MAPTTSGLVVIAGISLFLYAGYETLNCELRLPPTDSAACIRVCITCVRTHGSEMKLTDDKKDR